MSSPDRNTDVPIQSVLAAELDTVRASTDLSGPAIARAGVIRRRRRTMTAAGAALAALVVASPFLWWSTQQPAPVAPATSSAGPSGSTTTSGPAPTSSAPTTSQSSGPSATTTPAAPVPTGDADSPARRVTVDPGAPLVAHPELPYVLDTTLHRDGTTTTFEVPGPMDYHPLARGRSLVVGHPQGGGDTASVIDASGGIVAELPSAAGRYLTAAVNDAGTRFVLYDSSMQGSEATAILSVFDEAGAPLHQKRNVLSNVRVVGFVGQRVFLTNTTTGRSSVWDLDAESIEPYTEGIIAAVHEQTGRAALFPASDFDAERCTTIADVTGPKPVPVSVTCGLFQPTEFSPDGRHLLGIEVPSDGMLQSPSRVIEVATGRAVVSFHEERPLDIDSGFLPDGSVALNLILAPVDGIEQNALMRCTIDGTCTRLTETVPLPEFGTEMAPRYTIVRR